MVMRLGLYALVVLSALVDSSDPTPSLDVYYRVSIDPSFSPFLTAQILDGMRDWEQHLPNVHFQVIFEPCVQNNCVAMVPVTMDYLRTHHQYRKDHPTIGWTDRDQRPVKVEIANDILLDIVRDYVVRHELGHVLGLGHNDSNETIMFWESSTHATTVTCADVHEYCEVHHVPEPTCTIP